MFHSRGGSTRQGMKGYGQLKFSQKDKKGYKAYKKLSFQDLNMLSVLIK